MRLPSALAVVALVSLVAACGNAPGSVRAGAFRAVETVDGSLAVVRPASWGGGGGGNDAAISGTLAVVDGGCLGLGDDGGSQIVVVWPSGTAALPDDVGIDVPGMGTYRLGDEVEGGGGSTRADFEGPLAGCPADDVFFLNEDQS